MLERWRKTSSDPTAVKTQRPISSDDDHRVAQVPAAYLGTTARPRRRSMPRPKPTTSPATSAGRDEPDDFRHRMLANVAAFAFTVALTAIGIWLAMSIAELRKTQDCVLMGRRDCAQISAIPRG